MSAIELENTCNSVVVLVFVQTKEVYDLTDVRLNQCIMCLKTITFCYVVCASLSPATDHSFMCCSLVSVFVQKCVSKCVCVCVCCNACQG